MRYPHVVYIVAASKDGVTEEWAAATPAKEALVAVQLHAGPSWRIKLTDRTLTTTQARELNIRDGTVHRLGRA
jgi:hypothetical protein